MPIFEFKCRECNHIFEELIFSSNIDTSGLVCPECGAKSSEKLISTFSSAGNNSFASSGTPSCGNSGFS